jgi:hypothetical protein
VLRYWESIPFLEHIVCKDGNRGHYEHIAETAGNETILEHISIMRTKVIVGAINVFGFGHSSKRSVQTDIVKCSS